MQPEITPEYLASQGLSKNFPDRFWSKVRKTKTCWLWTAPGRSAGYGLIWPGLKTSVNIRAHQASWILNCGPIPKGKNVLHNCPKKDNKICVNPAHLYLGTDADNGRDSSIKGQITSGENHYKHKLTWKAVDEIRTSTLPEGVLAKKFGVYYTTINKVVHFYTWKPRSFRH